MTDPVHSEIKACYPGIMACGSADARLFYRRKRLLVLNVNNQAIRLDAGMTL